MAFPNIPRFTRNSQKARVSTLSSVNTSYEAIIHKEVRKSDSESMSMDMILTDLRNKLASSHALNADLQIEIATLKSDLKEKNNQIMILDGKLNYVLLAKKNTSENSTQTAPVNVTDNCTQAGTNSILEVTIADSFSQTDITEITSVSVDPQQQNLTTIGNSVVEIIGVKDASIPVKNTPCTSKSVRMQKTKEGVLLIRPRINLITDEIGRNLAIEIKNKFSSNYWVTATVKSGDTFGNIMKYAENSSHGFTKSDHVIVLTNSRHAGENTTIYMKRVISKFISGFNHTNLLMATIPYRYDDFSNNDIIHQINQHIEKMLFKYENKLCLYTNKILLKDDFNKRNQIKTIGLSKLAGAVHDYVVKGLCDDRIMKLVTSATDCQVQPVAQLTCKPSTRGTTMVAHQTLRTVPKNKQPIRRNKLLCLLKELLSILN